MDAARPWLFLDVDGVLNAYARSPRSPRDAFRDFRAVEAMGYRLWLSREMGERLASLAVDIAWSTTWSPVVDNHVAGAVGLPLGLPVASTPPAGPVQGSNWKLVQVCDFLARDERPFVWLDDDALDEPGPLGVTPRQWAAGLDVPNLLIAPSPRTGLRPSELDRIEAWLAESKARR